MLDAEDAQINDLKYLKKFSKDIWRIFREADED